jgi:hypothetical protein
LSNRTPARRETWIALAVILLSSLVVWRVQPVVAKNFEEGVISSDVYALPSPEQTLLVSLGHRAALADLLYGTVRVSFGRHIGQRRRFEFVENYLDTITTLDPTFAEPYLFADTFLTLQAGAQLSDYYAARRILRRGMEALPYHQYLWSTAGQFMTYLATSRIEDRDEAQRWRLEGAQALSHACSLGSDNKNIPYHCIAAAQILDRAGERDAMIQMLTRTLAVTDDPEIRRMASVYLEQHVTEASQARDSRRSKEFHDAWRADLPYVSPDMMLVLGPRADVASCAGASPLPRLECATSWRDWGQLTPSSTSSPVAVP